MKKRLLRGISAVLIFTLLVGNINVDMALASDRVQYGDKDEVTVIEGTEVAEGAGGNYHVIESYTSVVENDKSIFSVNPVGVASLPAKYDSRNDYNITPVKNQGSYGTCWTFAAINAAESSYLKNGLYNGSKIEASQTVDFSEFAFGYNYYHRKGQNDKFGNTLGDYTEGKYTSFESPSKAKWYNRGGNNRMTSFYMVNWESPANEDEYNKYDNVDTKIVEADRYFDNAIHIQEARFFSSSNVDYRKYNSAVKEHIMNQGSVMISYYSDTNNYLGNTMYSTYIYCPIKYDNGSNSVFKPNHSVSIIGWDDEIAKENFKATYNGREYMPSQNGAWLIKNSWGNSRQANGYFWLSYEDKSIEDVIGIAAEKKDNFDNIIYYDGGTGVNSYSSKKGIHNYNIFTNDTGEAYVVKAGGFAVNTSSPDSPIKYCMQVYKNRIPGNPESGMAMLDTPVTGTFNWAGYYTVRFPQGVRIEEGETYSIDVWFPENDQVSLFVDKDSDYSWIENHTTGKPKISYHGEFDIYKNSESDETKNNYSTIRIKAYVDKAASDIRDAQISYSNQIDYDETGNAFDPIVKYDGVVLERDKDYEIVEISGNAGRPGQYKVKINGIGKYTGQVICEYTINKAKVIIKANDAKIVSGNCIDKYKYSVTGYKKNIPEEIINISCSANSTSLPGQYPIEVSVKDGYFALDCYEVICVNGVLTILNTTKQDEVLYTVSFNGMGKCPNPANQYIPFNGHPIKPQVSAEGYKIVGWYEDPDYKKEWDFDVDSPKGYDVCLYAKWEELNYKIKYNKNLNSGVGEIPDEILKYSQETNIKSEKMFAGLEDYIFKGWNTKPDGSGITFYPGNIVSGKTFGITQDEQVIQLYGQWNSKVETPEFAPVKESYEYGDKISIATKTEGAVIHYIVLPVNDTSGQLPDVNSPVYKNEIVVTGNMLIKAYAEKEGSVNSDIAEIRVYMTTDQGDILDDDLEKYCQDGIPSGLWIAGYPVGDDEFVYDGKEKTFTVRVYDHNKLLKQGVDYTYKFKNNRNACEELGSYNAPFVQIKGSGNYKGTFVQKFVIRCKDIGQDSDVTEFYSPEMVYPFNGKKVSYVPELYRANGKKMKLGKDFDYQILNAQGREIYNPTVAGTYTVIINGVNNYCGSRQVKMHIVKDPCYMSTAKVMGVRKKMTYNNGEEIFQPAIKVYTSNGKKLEENIDYKISYLNNKNVGKAIILIEGLGGQYNMYGAKIVNFEIKGISIKNCKVDKFWDKNEDSEYPYVYNGQEIKVPVAVYKYVETDEDSIESYLDEESDYTVEYKNNINAGKAQVIIRGCGNYVGTIKKSFKIKRANIMDASMEYNEIIGYQRSGAKPEVTVYYDDTELIKNSDYKVLYKNNKKVNDRSTENELKHPYIVVKGIGNYCGTMHDPELPYTFEIQAKSFNDVEMPVSANAADVIANGQPGKWRSKFIVKDSDGKTLKEGRDYTTPVYTLAENGSELFEGMTVMSGKEIIVTAEGIGNYKDTITASYRIVDNTIENARVIIDSKVYSSEGVTLEPEDLTVLTEGRILKYGRDYEIAGFQNNKKTGKGYVIIRGLGEYGGTKKVSFKITPKEIG